MKPFEDTTISSLKRFDGAKMESAVDSSLGERRDFSFDSRDNCLQKNNPFPEESSPESTEETAQLGETEQHRIK
ncbi:uncharacterized protein N7479_004878 [Penicillium vulpinum]|uniref:uncharacterized protein n=1 Tax=Penicillium vulpinum TaxID=29845 RepID=UPI002547E2AF|nr:uncharacterized protein N7479_004878 [Penicillium vulpinum]KAJ5965002.1 hypothetical protein N7479_004878 [Penicillium vulpinum]